MNKKCISIIIVKLFKCLNFSSTFILRLLNFEIGYGKLLYDGRGIFVKEKDLVEIEDTEVSDEIDNIEELEDSFELDDEVDEKTRKKDEKRRKKEEKQRIRKIKNEERKRKFFFFAKVVLTILIILFTGLLNSVSFMLLGYSRIANLFVIPSLFVIPGLLIPAIWVKKGYKGVFFVIWLICSLTYIVGFVLPTLFMEYQAISLAFGTVFEWITSMITWFGGLFV